eukprot:11023404-Karenia_brevis.AAC.1
MDAQNGYHRHNASQAISAAVEEGLIEAEEAEVYSKAVKQANWWKHDADAFPEPLRWVAPTPSKRKWEDLVD